MTELGMSASIAEARHCLETGDGLRVDAETGCMIWHRPAPNGFGPFSSFFSAGKGFMLPPELELIWACHNGANGCVNPDHMWVGTPAEHERHKSQALDGRDREAWAQAILAERKARNWSQQRMADELKVGKSTVKNWEHGRSAPSRTMARMVGYRLGWELEPRKWVISVLLQDVVVASTAGEAAQKVLAGLALDGRKRKGEVVHARVVK